MASPEVAERTIADIETPRALLHPQWLVFLSIASRNLYFSAQQVFMVLRRANTTDCVFLLLR
jgi:hypothetical protein